MTDREAPGVQKEVQDTGREQTEADSGRWVSERPTGPKVCTLRLDSAHLLHTGLAQGWTQEETQAYFQDCAVELVRPAPGTMVPPLEWPLEVGGWGEAIRFAHEEFWSQGGPTGTTLVLEHDRVLWVLTHGTHRVVIHDENENEIADHPSEPPWGGKLWRLSRESQYRVEVALPDSPGPIWTARWVHTEPPARSSTAERIKAAPVSPVSLEILINRLTPTVKRRLAVSGTVAAGLLSIALLVAAIPRDAVRESWIWMEDYLRSRYRAELTSVPQGARILVDGQDTELTTPSQVVLEEGTHRLELSFDEFGSEFLELNGTRGDRVRGHRDLLGSIAIGSSDTSVVLFARIDDQPLGALPAFVDSVPIGRRRLSFQGKDIRPWAEEVDIVLGSTTQFIAKPERVPDTGVLMARAFTVNDEGVEEFPGATVYLDGRRVGRTPARLEVPRGYHTVRLVNAGERSPVQLLRVHGGGELFATAEFGRSPEPEVIVQAENTGSLGQPPVIRASLQSPGPIRIRQIRFFSRPPGGEFERLKMVKTTGTQGVVGEITAPIRSLQPKQVLEYFVVIQSDQGEEFVSEIRRMWIVP